MNLDLDSALLPLGPPLPNVDLKNRLIAPIVKKLNRRLGTMLKAVLSMPFVWLWVCWMAISMSSRSSGSLVAAQSVTPGGANETLGISDSKITYQPELGRWTRRRYTDSNGLAVEYVSVNEFVLDSGAGGTILTSPRVNVTFRGSAVRYLSPIFPFNSSVRVAVDNRPQRRISLFDNSTARPGGGDDDPEPSGVRTFTLAEQLDASADHIVVVSSDSEDGNAFMHVGQFIVASVPTTSTVISSSVTPSTSETAAAASSGSGSKLKIILPVTLIGSCIIIGLVVGLLFCHFRKKKASQGSSGQRGWGWDAAPLTAPAAAFVRRLSRRGPPAPTAPHVTPFSAGSDESALKGGDDFEDYVEAAAFQRKPNTMPYQDMSTVHRPASSADPMHSFSSVNDGGVYVPARLTQENLAALSSNPSRVNTPTTANLNPPPIAISQRHRGHDHRSVVSANTAELLARDIPYLPYLHTLAQPSEHGRSRESQPQTPPVPLQPQRRTNHSSLESASRPTIGHQPSRNTSATASDPFKPIYGRTSSSAESHGKKSRASPGLYPTYFPSADPTAAAIIERGEQDVMLTSQKVFRPNRRQGSGESSGAGDTTEDSAEGYGSQYPSMSSRGSRSQPPVPPPNPTTLSQPAGGRRQGSLRRKAVPTIQELEASSTSSLEKQERRNTPPAPSAAYTPQSYNSHPPSSQAQNRGSSDSSVRPLPGPPRPLPQTPPSHAAPITATSSADGSAGHASSNQHSTSTHAKYAGSPPPSSYHATSGHESHPPVTSSSQRHDKKPSGSRSPRGARSGANGGGNGKEREQYDPVWYPERAAPVVQDDFDDMYVDAESPLASPRMFVQGSSGR